jgi:hypothetical protein
MLWIVHEVRHRSAQPLGPRLGIIRQNCRPRGLVLAGTREPAPRYRANVRAMFPSTPSMRYEADMNILLVRVGADLSSGGGRWNGPVDPATGEFAYVPIPETASIQPGLEKPYSAVTPVLQKFGVALPEGLRSRHMHLDPDFQHLTYGDQGERAKQLAANLGPGDAIIFYAALADIKTHASLVYSLIGMLVVDRIVRALDIPASDYDCNAHTRRILREDASDLIVFGRAHESGRFRCCIPVGEYRDRAYRVRRELLAEWGGLSVKDGYLQRSARLPRFLAPETFRSWLDIRSPTLLQTNN